MQSSGVDYLPILLQIGVVGGFVVFVLFITHYLGPRLKSKKKDSNWECGIESQGDARFPVSIRYFMTAILFVLFDVEVIFFNPWATNFRDFGFDGFISMLIFVAFFLLGFLYLKKKDAFKWE